MIIIAFGMIILTGPMNGESRTVGLLGQPCGFRHPLICDMVGEIGLEPTTSRM